MGGPLAAAIAFLAALTPPAAARHVLPVHQNTRADAPAGQVVGKDQGAAAGGHWGARLLRSHRALFPRPQLSPSYAQALKEIDKQLEHWPKYMIHRNKQRLTKIHQYLIRMRKLRTRVRCGPLPPHFAPHARPRDAYFIQAQAGARAQEGGAARGPERAEGAGALPARPLPAWAAGRLPPPLHRPQPSWRSRLRGSCSSVCSGYVLSH